MIMQTEKPSIVISLEHLFNEINDSLFEGKLKLPTMVFQPERRLDFNYVGHTKTFVIGGRFAEISNLGQMYEKFLHEMVHVDLIESGIKLTKNYHNSSFLNAALRVGFHVSRNRTIGWGITTFDPPKEGDFESPTKEAFEKQKKTFRECEFGASAFLNAQKEIRLYLEKSGRPKQYFMKYVCKCPPPHNSIRSGRRPDSETPLKVICLECGYNFICVEGSEDTPLPGQEHSLFKTSNN